jgi:hypothetical protein
MSDSVHASQKAQKRLTAGYPSNCKAWLTSIGRPLSCTGGNSTSSDDAKYIRCGLKASAAESVLLFSIVVIL